MAKEIDKAVIDRAVYLWRTATGENETPTKFVVWFDLVGWSFDSEGVALLDFMERWWIWNRTFNR